jgi:hypothetical protein
MSSINLVMSLQDFSRYVEDILGQGGGALLVEVKDKEGISLQRINHGESDHIKDGREKDLQFFIVSDDSANVDPDDVFDDELSPWVIAGEGGRATGDSIERLSLRVLAKKPHRKTTQIFNSIKRKLKKDGEIGVGVQGGSKLHDDYFYEKKYIGKKVFKTDLHNDKAPVVEAKEN